jgi:hypothetical protein
MVGLRVIWPLTRSHLFKKKATELEMTIRLIKVCSVQWKMPLKLLACLAVSTPDGVNASGIPSAVKKLQDLGVPLQNTMSTTTSQS